MDNKEAVDAINNLNIRERVLDLGSKMDLSQDNQLQDNFYGEYVKSNIQEAHEEILWRRRSKGYGDRESG
jgi:hypothetical protein